MAEADQPATAPAPAEAADIPPPPAAKPSTKITAHKFNYMRTMLAKKLTEVQQEHTRTALEQGAEDQDEEAVGMQQEELMRWYMDTQAKR